jgi:hypothetical protein
VEICRDGGIGEPRELVDLSGREVSVEVNLRNGSHSATIWTNDLTYEYVKEKRSTPHEPRDPGREGLDPHRNPPLAGDVRGKTVVIKYGGNAMIDGT